MKNHLKRITAPKNWDVARKAIKFVAKPNPGMHRQELGVALGFALRDMLGIAKTRKEAYEILRTKDVLVDGRRRKDGRFNIGFMDTLSFPLTKQHHRVVFNKRGKLAFITIPEKESNQKLVRIIGKTPRGKQFQINTGDGRNILAEKADYKVNDTLLIELPTQKILGHFPLEKGASIMLVGGKHIGTIATVESIEGKNIIFKTEKDLYETNKRYALAIGSKGKPALTLQ